MEVFIEISLILVLAASVSIVMRVLKQPLIEEVEYQEAIVKLINKNVKTLGLIILAITALLLIISLTLSLSQVIELGAYIGLRSKLSNQN